MYISLQNTFTTIPQETLRARSPSLLSNSWKPLGSANHWEGADHQGPGASLHLGSLSALTALVATVLQSVLFPNHSQGTSLYSSLQKTENHLSPL